MTDFTIDFIAASASADSESPPNVGYDIFDEPGADPDTSMNAGFGGQFADYTEYKIYNGAFRNGPPDPTANVDPFDSVSGSNFMPNWRFVQASNTNITSKQVRNTAYPSGSNARFTFASGAAADEAFWETIVDIGGDEHGDFPDHVRTRPVAGGSNTGTFGVGVRLQYLTVDGTITGMPAEVLVGSTLAAGATATLEGDATTSGIAPLNARKLRIRFGVSRSGAANGATGTIDFPTVRRTRGVSKQVFPASGTWRKPSGAQWVQVTVIGAGGGGGSGRRGAAGTVRAGGGGGGGGGTSIALFSALDLTDTVTVTVGAGGAGGTAPVVDNTDGVFGLDGAASTFGAYLWAGGGTGGVGGTTGIGAGGTGGLGQFTGGVGGIGTRGSASGDFGGGLNGGYTGGGGGGAGIDAGNTAFQGGAAGFPRPLTTIIALASGGSGGNSGDAGVPPPTGAVLGGSGSGGSGTNGSGTNTTGAQGSGGGGGGGRLNGGQGKTGGSGGDGYVAVVAW